MPGSSRRELEMTNTLGLHLRAASLFVRVSHQFQAKVWVSCKGLRADGRSVLDLMLLGAECGVSLEIEASGPDAEEAIAALCTLIEERFHEDEDGRAESAGP
jgi:phosphocarrier protein HPr